MKKYEEVEEPVAQPIVPPVKKEVKPPKTVTAANGLPIYVIDNGRRVLIGQTERPINSNPQPITPAHVVDPQVVQLEMPPRYCKDCTRFYNTGADQCEVPACGLEERPRSQEDVRFEAATGVPSGVPNNPVDLQGQQFIRQRSRMIHFSGGGRNSPAMIYGHPSQLNYDNSCYFYNPKQVDTPSRPVRQSVDRVALKEPSPSNKKSWLYTVYEFLRDVMKS